MSGLWILYANTCEDQGPRALRSKSTMVIGFKKKRIGSVHGNSSEMGLCCEVQMVTT